jgi:hypothetical protein
MKPDHCAARQAPENARMQGLWRMVGVQWCRTNQFSAQPLIMLAEKQDHAAKPAHC